jgi:hypothetical protein
MGNSFLYHRVCRRIVPMITEAIRAMGMVSYLVALAKIAVLDIQPNQHDHVLVSIAPWSVLPSQLWP